MNWAYLCWSVSSTCTNRKGVGAELIITQRPFSPTTAATPVSWPSPQVSSTSTLSSVGAPVRHTHWLPTHWSSPVPASTRTPRISQLRIGTRRGCSWKSWRVLSANGQEIIQNRKWWCRLQQENRWVATSVHYPVAFKCKSTSQVELLKKEVAEKKLNREDKPCEVTVIPTYRIQGV